jgi:Ca2+-binding EF-hand superfamily protein
MRKRRIQRREFIQQLTQWAIKITPFQREQLAAVFSDQNGDIDYGLFCDEIASAIVAAPPPAEGKPVFSAKADFEKTIEYLKETVRRRNSQIHVALRSYDTGHTGLVPSGRFVHCLSANEFKVTPPDTEVLLEHFGDGRGSVEYERFITAIMPPSEPPMTLADFLAGLSLFLHTRKMSLRPLLPRSITLPDLLAAFHKLSFNCEPQEQSLLRSCFRGGELSADAFCREIDYVPEVAVPPPEPAPEPDTHPPPPHEVLCVLRKLKKAESKVDFAEDFRSRDFLRRGVIPTSQFASIVIGPTTGIGRSEADLLASYYAVPGQKVNYVTLLRDQEVCPLDEPTLAPPTRPLDQLLALFQKELVSRRLDPPDLFLKYDRTRTGLVFGVRVATIFDSVGIKLTEEEDKVIRNTFADPDSPELFNYRSIAKFMTPKDARPKAAEPVDTEFLLLLVSLRERIRSRRRRLADAFAHGFGDTVSERVFREALGTFGLALREHETQRLLRNYRSGSRGDVDWRRFVADVESARAPG